MKKEHVPFWVLTSAYASAFMLPLLLSEGTFLDGLIYAVLARNTAAGLGSFWAPHYSIPSGGGWFEHPPLGLNIESLFYRVLGEGLWVEHIHSLATFLVCGWLLVVLWRVVVRDDDQLRRLSWLPILFWVMNPQVTWAYANNMLENTMTVFSLAAVIFLLRSCRTDRNWLLNQALGTAAIITSILTKGSVGLFPLATFAVYQLATRQFGWVRTVWRSLLLVGSVAVLLGLVWLIPEARHGLTRYYDSQLHASLSGTRGSAGNQAMFLVKLFNTLIPAVVVALLIMMAGWRKRLLRPVNGGLLRWSVVMLLLGMAGSVPLVVSPRQSMFYVLPSFPFYAMALALPVATIVAALVEALRNRTRLLRGWQVAAGVLLIGAVAFSATKIGTYNRSAGMVRDIKLIGPHVRSKVEMPADQEYVVGLCRKLYSNWGLDVNLTRYYHLTVAREDAKPLFVIGTGSCADELGPGYVQVPLQTSDFHLFTRK